MKLTTTQLKQIIREEIQKSINEAPIDSESPIDPKTFYQTKCGMLEEVIAAIDSNDIESALVILD